MRPTTLFLFPVLLLAVVAHTEQVPVAPDPLTIAATYPGAMPSGPELTAPQSVMPAPVIAPAPAAQPERPRPKVIDKKFIALAALVVGLTAADVELTQHCLEARTCYEMNPSLPRSRWGQYAVNTVTNAAVMYLAYHRRARGKWGWWLSPVIDIGAHGAGIGSNLRFAW
ncbi:MAG: hypothetical protein ACE14M_13720 [Terriglobales bacterium]